MSMNDACVSLTNAPRELRGLHRTTTLMLPSPSAMVKVEYKAGANYCESCVKKMFYE